MLSVRVMTIFGTRPEAIKLAPVIRALGAHARFEPVVVASGQHRELLGGVYEHFGFAADHELETLSANQPIDVLTARVLTEVSRCIERVRPDYVLVHGDTTTTFAASLAAFYAQVPLGHLEAGLRTSDLLAPFPEELNRRMVALMATDHFAPTARARDNLVALGIPEASILVAGNTVIDALMWTRERVEARIAAAGLDRVLDATFITEPEPAIRARLLEAARSGALDEGRWVLVTGHRRESFGAGIENICEAVAELAAAHPQWRFVFPVHLNPRVDAPVRARLSGLPNVDLLPPLRYDGFVALLARCSLVLTDSGGLQEEAPALGKPVVVMRERTERPEALEAGAAFLVGTDPRRIFDLTSSLMARGLTVAGRELFGDGQAAERIVARLAERHTR